LLPVPERERAVAGGEVEDGDHPHPRHHVAAPRRVGIGLAREVAVHRRRDVDRALLDPQRLRDEAGVVETLVAGGAVGQADPHHVLRAERARGEERRDRRVHAAGEAEHRAGEAAPRELVAHEGHEPPLHERRVDLDRGRAAAVAQRRAHHRDRLVVVGGVGVAS
jgi:hypothetical protein